MTKKNFFCLLVLIVAFSCVSRSRLYEIPDAMKTEDRLLTKDSCDKGYNLYVLNCAACHNDTVKGKAVIPDFTYQQLENYEIRFLNEQHIIQLDERKLSQEELSFILTFLRYKKKNKA